MGTTKGNAVLERLRTLATPLSKAELAAQNLNSFNFYFKMRGLLPELQLDALDYLVDGNQASARTAITRMLDTLRNVNFGTANDMSRASGLMITCGAMIYDWCYDELTESEKSDYISQFCRIAATMECGYPISNYNPCAGHSCEWMILRDLLSCGIAIYDEYPAMLNSVQRLLDNDYVPVRNYGYAGGAFHQGTSYINTRLGSDLTSLWIMSSSGFGTIYSDDLRQLPYELIYRRRPDGEVLPSGDTNPASRTGERDFALVNMLSSSFYGDKYIARSFERSSTIPAHMAIFELLWRDFDLGGKDPDDLPLTRYFGTPYGWMIARTGWGSDAVIAEIKVNEQYYGNHQHLDAGSFQIYYKGPLAIDSGIYSGTSGSYNDAHNMNYSKRTIAHNSLLIYDPSENTGSYARDGGQRLIGGKWATAPSFSSLRSSTYKMGKAQSHYSDDDVSYLKGDITSAYTSKVEDVHRSFVFLNLHESKVPAAMVVFDHVVASDASYGKYFLLHSIEEPDIAGHSGTVSRSLNGDSGRLHLTTVLPEDAALAKIGGSGKEFMVFGTNYPSSATDPAHEAGAWRIEVTPGASRKEDCFLNVMQVTDNTNIAYKEVVRVDGSSVAGVKVADRVVTFSRNASFLSGSFSFEVPACSGTLKFVVTDLSTGSWSVSLPSGGNLLCNCADGENMIKFEGTSGVYTITKL